MSISANPSAETEASACAGPQQTAAFHCAEAERLGEAARRAAEQLLLARRRRAEIDRAHEGQSQFADRRHVNDAKLNALDVYRTEYEHARDGGQLMVATATWLSELSRVNLGARRAMREAAGVAQRQLELDGLVRRLQLAADAGRIAAAAARQACLDARRQLAACEEAHDARMKPGPATGTVPAAPSDTIASLERAPQIAIPAQASEPAVVALLRGDRRMLQTVVSRLAEEIGQDAGRLQLLMLDLRDAITASGRQACIFDFPPRHPFWGQFSLAEARAVAAALATLGRRFDGHDGWEGGQAAVPRELAIAMSLAGRDPRSVRRHPAPAEIEVLWQGTSVAAAEHLLANAPELRLEALIGLLGPRADTLAELWDNWGRLRPLLLGTDPTLP